MKFMAIPRDKTPAWWHIRFYFFMVYGAFSFIAPYMTLFHDRQGFSGEQIGWLGSVGAMIGLLAAPLWGRWSDNVSTPRRLLQFALLMSLGVLLVLSQQTNFWITAALLALNGFAFAAVEPLSANLAVGRSGSNFGSVRLWGSLGWAVLVVLAGYLIEQYSIQAMFRGYAVVLIGAIMMLNLLPRPQKRTLEKDEPEENLQPPTSKVLREFVRSPLLMSVAAALMIHWITSAGAMQFTSLYMETLGASELIIGVSAAISAVVELWAMLWADRLVQKYSAYRMLQLFLVFYLFMVGSVVIYPSVIAILISRFFLGFAYSLYVVSIVAFVNRNAPFGQSTTVLAIYMTTLRSLIMMIASPGAGWLYDLYGAYWLYVIALVGGAVGVLILGVPKNSWKRLVNR
jgi:PPP family 3-phenylpropionic acid transporter